jgi:AcrR family transcriptional regulator
VAGPDPAPSGPVRPLRADARRNRARLLEVAYQVFAAEGLAVPIDEIARRAGVGAGTVYRHFPTKEALFQAIVVDRVDRLVEQAHALAGSADPGEAFFGYFLALVEEGASNRVLSDAMAGGAFDLETAAPGAEERLRAAFGELLKAAQQAGAVRPDIDVSDVKALLVGCDAMVRYRGDPAAAHRLATIAFDGLRPG